MTTVEIENSVYELLKIEATKRGLDVNVFASDLLESAYKEACSHTR